MHNNADLDLDVMCELQAMLGEYHQYAPVYRYAFEVLRQHDAVNDAVVRLWLSPGLDRHCYNLPTTDEIAVVLPDDPSTEPQDIILHLRSGPLQRISDLHPAYAPLQYPLLFPHGENGWFPEMKLWETAKQRNNRVQNHQQRQQERLDHGLEVQARPDSELRRLTLT